MISEAIFKELLERKAEFKNVDYKESFNWNSASKEAKCELVKDVLALMNTQDGGHIIFGVRNSTFEAVGLGADDFSSFDTTKVNDFVHRYADPAASCEVQKISLSKLNFVVINVPEFQDVPIICKKDAHSSSDQSKLILKAGGLYIRTDKATSVLMPSAEHMRELMNRALLKRGDRLLATIETLFRGKPGAKEPAMLKYRKELEAAREYFQRVLPENFEAQGYWEIISTPETYSRERTPDLTTLLKFLMEAKVSLRGWPFPYFDREALSNFSNGTQSHTVSGRYVEAHRAYQSGLFIWRGAYRENAPEFARQHGKALSYVIVIYEMTEMFEFLKRFYTRIAPDSDLHVSIRLNDIYKRQLVATNFDDLPYFGGGISHESTLLIERDHTVPDLRASATEHANDVVRRIFEVFNWNNPDPNFIRGWQQRLLSRTL